jgi:hypothetical protein
VASEEKDASKARCWGWFGCLIPLLMFSLLLGRIRTEHRERDGTRTRKRWTRVGSTGLLRLSSKNDLDSYVYIYEGDTRRCVDDLCILERQKEDVSFQLLRQKHNFSDLYTRTLCRGIGRHALQGALLATVFFRKQVHCRVSSQVLGQTCGQWLCFIRTTKSVCTTDPQSRHPGRSRSTKVRKHSLNKRTFLSRFSQVSCMELWMDLESDCVGFEQVQGLGSAATNPWPCLLEHDLIRTTNHGFDILAHGSQTHTETWEIFACTCKRHARSRGTTAARLLECGPWTCNHFA